MIKISEDEEVRLAKPKGHFGSEVDWHQELHISNKRLSKIIKEVFEQQYTLEEVI